MDPEENMSIMFNEICINEEMLPKYTYIYIYIYTHMYTHVYVYVHLCIYTHIFSRVMSEFNGYKNAFDPIQ